MDCGGEILLLLLLLFHPPNSFSLMDDTSE